MRKSCEICGISFEFTDKDFEIFKRFDVPEIKTCFECDQKSRICFRNERTLYKRKCDATGTQIISTYSPNAPYKIYKSDYWYGDSWDALEYGRDFDFSKTFFEQFAKLQMEVPRIALTNIRGVNSEYCNMTYGNKNCYLLFGADYNEDTMFGILSMGNKDSAEINYSNQCVLCYEIQDCLNCYNTNYATDCKECTDCEYIANCIGCRDCILCTNLINQNYCIENQKLPKTEYTTLKKRILEDRNTAHEKFIKIRAERIVKYANITNCENCTGDYLRNCKNCLNSFDCTECEDFKNVLFGSKGSKDCFYSSMIGDNCQVCFNDQSCFNVYNNRHSFFTIDSSDVEYSELTTNSKNIFGCVGMKHKYYCIFNKQYSENDFFTLRKRIIEHMKETCEWGKFFPRSLSCYGYNETTAHIYWPMTEEKTIEQGFKWKPN